MKVEPRPSSLSTWIDPVMKRDEPARDREAEAGAAALHALAAGLLVLVGR